MPSNPAEFFGAFALFAIAIVLFRMTEGVFLIANELRKLNKQKGPPDAD